MLNWMHDASSSLNPENSQELDNFKGIQQEVRTQKLKFETKMRDIVERLQFCDQELHNLLESELFSGLCGLTDGEYRPLKVLGNSVEQGSVDYEQIRESCLQKAAHIQ